MSHDAALFKVDGDGGRNNRGPVYQAVAKQIRALIADGTVDADLQAGQAAAARSLAHSIDQASGVLGGKREYGASLAAMHAQLDEQLKRLAGDGTGDDAFTALLHELNDA